MIDNEADVNIKSEDGNTALMSACGSFLKNINRLEIVRYLIEKGADVNVKNKYGESALDKAELEKYPEIIDILKNAGAKKGIELK